MTKEWVSRGAFHKVVVDIMIYWMLMTMFEAPVKVTVFFSFHFFILLSYS